MTWRQKTKDQALEFDDHYFSGNLFELAKLTGIYRNYY
jgi:hypothetical protein